MLPVTRGLSQLAGAARRTPATAVAGAVGAAAGVAIAVEAGRLNGPAAPPTERTAGQDRAAARTALDVNHDDMLQCREIGTWIPDVGVDTRSPNAQAYQTHVTGVLGMDFKVTSMAGEVRFDGCVDQPVGAKLLEAKGDHRSLLSDGASGWSKARIGIVKQGRTQQDAATFLGVNAEWHAQTRSIMPQSRRSLEREVLLCLSCMIPCHW